MSARRSNQHLSQLLVGWGLLVEGIAWAGFCAWATRWAWTHGVSYYMGSLMWAALALPILVSGLGLLRPPHRTGVRRAVFIACLVVSLLWNIGLSVFTFYLGIGFDPTVAISTRVLSLLVAGTSVVLTAGIVSALRSSQPGWRRHLIHPS